MYTKKKFRVLIDGTNLLTIKSNGVQKIGYFTTRYVEGDDDEEASASALELVRNELNAIGILLQDPNDPPRNVITDVEPIDSFEGVTVPGRGFAFFADN